VWRDCHDAKGRSLRGASLFQKKCLPDFIPDHPDRIETIVEDALLEEFLMGATLCEAVLWIRLARGIRALLAWGGRTRRRAPDHGLERRNATTAGAGHAWQDGVG
jgi:hypothetical protein